MSGVDGEGVSGGCGEVGGEFGRGGVWGFGMSTLLFLMSEERVSLGYIGMI